MKKRVNYDFERRMKEQDRKRKKEEKRQRREEARARGEEPGEGGALDAGQSTDETPADGAETGGTS